MDFVLRLTSPKAKRGLPRTLEKFIMLEKQTTKFPIFSVRRLNFRMTKKRRPKKILKNYKINLNKAYLTSKSDSFTLVKVAFFDVSMVTNSDFRE